MLLLAAPSLGAAQAPAPAAEKRLGVVIAYPAAAGLQWQVNDRFTLRGDVAFDWGRLNSVNTSSITFGTPGATVTTTSTAELRRSSASIGVSGLVTVARHDQLRLYVAPRVGWTFSRSGITTETVTMGLAGVTQPGQPERVSSSTIDGIVLDGMFGASYRLGDRFEVFGEAGVSYERPMSSGSSPSSDTTSHVVGLRSGVGIVIRF
jgi:hypothetical protein